tara:strand:+ start:298 stop:495 length:198 start_codon:yes stop_codon:yes gene_type:complete
VLAQVQTQTGLLEPTQATHLEIMQTSLVELVATVELVAAVELVVLLEVMVVLAVMVEAAEAAALV